MSINLNTLFTNLGIVGGNTAAKTQYDFYYGIEWSDGSKTYNQYEFFKKIGQSRYNFFKQYLNEYQFYRDTTNPNITNFRTFYEFAAEDFVEDWILDGGIWNDFGVWGDSYVWID